MMLVLTSVTNIPVNDIGDNNIMKCEWYYLYTFKFKMVFPRENRG